MAKDRLETLRQWVDDAPDDAFSRYAFALEFKKLGRDEEALGQFSELVLRNPEYCATYFHYSSLLVRVSRREDARAVLVLGLERCHRHGEKHAAEELERALAELPAIK